jgi:hypothetical protein
MLVQFLQQLSQSLFYFARCVHNLIDNLLIAQTFQAIFRSCGLIKLLKNTLYICFELLNNLMSSWLFVLVVRYYFLVLRV